MKKFLTLILALTLVFAMTACGNTTPTNDSVEPEVSVEDVVADTADDAVVEDTADEVVEEETVVEEAPAVEEEVVEEPVVEEVVSDDLVIKFNNLVAGGYGYEAYSKADTVVVSISAQYQEIQYVLPEVIDLAAYTTLIVDVVSNAQLDIKLVDPNAEMNEWSQLAPFHDGYTAEGAPITEPIYIDLAQFADKDLSQINFMAMGNDTEFTINKITFVK